MKSTELRIGNYVIDGNEVVILNDNYTLFKALINVDRNIGIKPIPLTEEWLLKFPKWFQELISGGYMNFSKLPKEYVEVKFVHTAQNLYFALTNEELTWTN